MITSNGTLVVLDNVHIDMTLPKYKKKVVGDPNFLPGVGTPDAQFGSTNEPNMSSDQFAMMGGVNRTEQNFTPFVQSGRFITSLTTQNSFNSIEISRKSFWQRVKDLLPKKKGLVAPVKPTVSVESVFALILQNEQQLEFVKDRLAAYDNSILKAQSVGQTALVEQLLAARKIHAYELQLFAVDRKKFIDEERVVKFAKDCEKGLRLTWMKNYVRAIPDVVMEQKLLVDQHRVFDAYVIMHYDPDAKSIKQTEAEKVAELEKKKDPILFGIIQGSRKLYFVGDWKDELCDLTFDAFVEKFGESTILLKGE